jgi:hypothetical protein
MPCSPTWTYDSGDYPGRPGRVAGRVEELGDGVVLRRVGHVREVARRPAWLHKNEPASGELSSSELNPYTS